MKELTDHEKASIEIKCWLKNGVEWYYPEKRVYLQEYKHVVLLQTNWDNNLYYAWHADDHENGRLFRA